MDLVLVQLQQLQEFVDNVGIRQEITALIGTVEEVWRLYFLKHCPNLVFDLGRNRGRRIAIQARQNMGGMLIVAITSQLLKNLTNVLLSENRNILDTSFPNFANHFIHHIIRNLRALLRLELVQNLVQMILFLIRIIISLFRRITETREIRDYQGILFRSTLGADQNTF